MSVLQTSGAFTRSWAWAVLLAAACLGLSDTATAQSSGYAPIKPQSGLATVLLTGDDLTPDQVVAVARNGARVEISPIARKRGEATYDLMLEAAAEQIPVYLFNRAPGPGREVVTFTGDPLSAENRPMLEARALRQFQNGARAGAGPEVLEEEVVRAMMVVRINCMTYEPASPQLLTQMIALLNDRITPVVQSHGGSGEADGPFPSNLNGAMVGMGEVYYGGVRMSAADALRRAGLKPLTPGGADTTVATTNAFATGQAALLVHDGRQALDWADLVYAVDLTGMNSSLTPLFMPVQVNRPFPWLNWEAARVLRMVRGGYLLDEDPRRIIQDPESLRASAIRQGSAWQAWGALRDAVMIQLNHSDHNPVVKVGAAPGDSWELSSPQAMKYYVKGGAVSHGDHGYVFSNANWDWYPTGNAVEAFTSALANMDMAVILRTGRFASPFFTAIKPSDVMTPAQLAIAAPQGQEKISADIWQDIQALSVPVTPSGVSFNQSVEDLQGQTRLKVARARQAVDETFLLLGEDLLTGAYWMDVRRAQDPTRAFGPAPTAVSAALRKSPGLGEGGPSDPSTSRAPPASQLVYAFMKANPASTFMPPEARIAPP